MSAAATAGFLYRTGRLVESDQGQDPATNPVERAWLTGYQVGLAQGELRGRLALAQELEAEFGPGAHEMTAEDLPAVVARQVH